MPEPLHPAVVHLPIALATLIPLLAILAILAIRWSFLPSRSWACVVLLQALLVGSAWLALETGEQDEERVERVVAERHVEGHEEAAELFLALAGLSLLAGAAGLRPGRMGGFGRLASTLAGFAVLASAVQVGHSGGALVYEHGAANAYLERSAARR
jgi:uncharacterized membrane protein